VALQKTIDYACGAGADCNFIHEQGPCYNPNTVVAHCSWAANSYFQRNRATGATCDFTGTATLTTADPSKGLAPRTYNLLVFHRCIQIQEM
jgi:hypothetical protein